jgi:hypothetical protein
VDVNDMDRFVEVYTFSESESQGGEDGLWDLGRVLLQV